MATLPKDAQELFDHIVPEGLKQHPDKARELNAVYCFKISGDGGGDWTVDLTANPPTCTTGDSGKAQCTVEVSHDDFKTMLSDPNADAVHGRITIGPATVVPDIVAGNLDPCAAAWHPDGTAGEGFIYAVVPGSAPFLTDVDSGFGCSDGLPDFRIAKGTCGATGPGSGDTVLFIDSSTPFPICVRRIDGTGTPIDVVVGRVGAGGLVLETPPVPLVGATYTGTRLPLMLSLGALTSPGPYVLEITATDDKTPVLLDRMLFDWNGERWMSFKRVLSAPSP